MGPLIKILLRTPVAAQVHLAITCPPIAHPCASWEWIWERNVRFDCPQTFGPGPTSVLIVEADSLYFISLEGMMQAIGRKDGY